MEVEQPEGCYGGRKRQAQGGRRREYDNHVYREGRKRREGDVRRYGLPAGDERQAQHE